MSENANLDAEVIKISRRDALRSTGGLLGGVLLGGAALSACAQEKPPIPKGVSAASIPVGKNFDPALWQQAPWKLDAKPPFDLEDAMGRWYALMKSTQNLVGARTYVSNYSRVYLCEVGREPKVFYGTCGTWTFQNVVPNPGQFPEFGELPPNTALQLGLYTGVVLDPFTFKPTEEIYNPALDRKVRAEDSVFAESYLLYPGGGMSSIERRQFMDSREPKKHVFVRSGNKLSWSLPALFAGEGDFQPRMDASWWTCNHDELMNPDLDLIDCDYSWVGLTRVGEKGWWGMPDMGDRVLMTLWNTHGTVTNKIENVEGIVREHVFTKYPERV